MFGHATYDDFGQIPAGRRNPIRADRHGTPAPIPRPRHPRIGQQHHNNTVERAIRPIALGRRTYLVVGLDAGGKAAAIRYTLFETAERNAVDPHARRADTLARIPDDKITKVGDLLPWLWNG